MKCGYCEKEMLEGYIPVDAVCWNPIYSSQTLPFYKGPKTEGFKIGHFQMWGRKKQRAWYCPECDVILINCKDEEAIPW